MKLNQRTVKITDTAHKAVSQLSERYRMSIAALVEIGIRTLAAQPQLVVMPFTRDPRSQKSNSRKVLAAK